MSDYIRETEWLFNQFPSYQLIGSKAYKPTLENTRELIRFIGNPEQQLTFVHVAGSNGKGSVSSMLASILTEAGYNVGLFTSPHIKDFRERIRINGACIDEQSVVDFIRTIKRQTFPFEPSFFEVSFAMALDYFHKQNCEICIIETGLGGRLDSTNVITPLLSIITSISLEHTQILGDTLEQIAREKAGIIKKGVPIVLGNISASTAAPIIALAKENESRVFSYALADGSEFSLPLLGNYQKDNFRTVLQSLKLLQESGFVISEKNIQNGLDHLNKNSGFTGRLQIMEQNPLVLYDVSHNADGIKSTMESVRSLLKGKLHIIYGTSNDKDIRSILKEFPTDAKFYFCQFTNPRSMQLTDLKIFAEPLNFKHAHFFDSAESARIAAKANADKNDIVLAIGSFFLISDFF